MNKKTLLFISFISGIIMVFAWLKTMMFGFIMLFALVPLLFMEDVIALRRIKGDKIMANAAFCYSYPAFFLWTLFNTLWITRASAVGYIVPVAEAAFMAIIFQLYSYSKKIAGNKLGTYFFLIFYWLGFEYIQFNWDVNFPWLNLGNSFADCPVLVQWYSVLGMEGGSLWVLLTNILIYLAIKDKLIKKFFPQLDPYKITDTSFSKGFLGKYTYKFFAAFIIIVPIFWSIILWFSYKDDAKQNVNVAVIQPNLNPYLEQYVLSPNEVMQRVENLAKKQMDTNVDYMLLPESCIQEYAWEDQLNYVPSIINLKYFLKAYPKCKIIAGMSSKRLLPEGVKTEAARKFEDKNLYYESCNIALQINNDLNQKDIPIHHKSVLTVGVEKMPFKKYLSFVEKLALNLGGTVGTLGVDTSVVVFDNEGIKIGVPICYEGIDGNYVRKFIQKGAQSIFIITNVGWWGDTPGYRQYFQISRLRAIENRRYTVTCANTGISGLVNARGEILEKSKYWVQDALKYSVPLNNKVSFFSLNGDIIMRPMLFFAIMLLIYSIVKNIISKKK